jgi:hypothetical protein
LSFRTPIRAASNSRDPSGGESQERRILGVAVSYEIDHSRKAAGQQSLVCGILLVRHGWAPPSHSPYLAKQIRLNLASPSDDATATRSRRALNKRYPSTTNPVGAKVDFSNGQSCMSPCTIKTKRDQSLQITLTHDGSNPQTATMIPQLAGSGVLLGGLIDYGTGAVYDLEPNPMTVTLVCGPGVAGGVAVVTPASAVATSPPSNK